MKKFDIGIVVLIAVAVTASASPQVLFYLNTNISFLNLFMYSSRLTYLVKNTGLH